MFMLLEISNIYAHAVTQLLHTHVGKRKGNDFAFVEVIYVYFGIN